MVSSLETTYVEEVEEKEESIPVQMDVDQDAKGIAANANAAAAQSPPKKRIVRRIKFRLLQKRLCWINKLLDLFKERESEMHATGKLVQDTGNVALLFSYRTLN